MSNSIATQTSARVVQRRSPNATNNERMKLRHSSQRQGNCMNRSFGAKFHNRADTGNNRTPHTPAQTARVFQSSRLFFRSVLAVQAAINTKPISATASQEMRWLKAS